MSNRLGTVALLAAATLPGSALAATWLDYIRNYDLNDYALGLATTVTQSPYVGTQNNVFTYPFLTSFRSNMLTDDWLILTDGDVGFRWIGDSGWMFGGVGRLNTLGFGSERAPELAGMEDRQWAIEIAPMIGFRRWPVQFEFKPYWEITGRHSGLKTQLLTSLPIGHDRGWITPQIRISHHDASFNRYYFGVSEAEAIAGRPAYDPGSSTDIEARLHWGFQVTDKWLLSGRLGYRWFGDAVVDSPIVDEDSAWSVNLGVAYNSDIFRARDSYDTSNLKPGFEIRVGLLRDRVDTEVRVDRSDGTVLDPVDMEDVFAINDRTNIAQIDAIWRLSRFHRLNFGYFELFRKATSTATEDVEIGDIVFPDGSEVDSRLEERTAYATYSYLFMSDSQKEVGVSAGLHWTHIRVNLESQETGQIERALISSPLPVIGAQGSIALGQRTSLALRLQFFRLNVDQYTGRLNYINFGVEHLFTNSISMGVGYQLYDLRLESDSLSLSGKYEVRHHGPFLFAGISFQ